MEHLRTNFTNGSPILASDKNETNQAVNELIDQAAKAVVYEEKTYAQIVALIAQNALVPGAFYRMTDFVTTAVDERETAQFRSAGHAFDLLLQALSTNQLSAKAAALPHADDTYFAGVELDKWQIWYDINNDTTKYNWADATNGKGVIYRLIDEHNNDCPYDFKNIQFKRWAITAISSTSLTADALASLEEALVYSQNGNRHMANKDIYGNWIPQDVQGTEFTIDEDNSGWYYTFDGISSEDGETPGDHYDMSAHPIRLSNECITYLIDTECGADYADYCKNNIIKSAYYEFVEDDQYFKGRQVLNNIVFANSMSYCYYDEEGESWNYTTNYCYANVFESECTYNTFGNYFYYNTFGNNCSYNTFGNNCQYNTFGNDCCYNTFGNDCYYNTFGNYFYYNTFGNGLYSNTFGNNCWYNTFGNNCSNNTFGNSCYNNTLGNECYNNTFGNDCRYNTFGNSCYNNTFGNYFQNNTFGNYCYNNTFGNDCGSNTFGNNCQYITAFEGIQFLDITGGSTDSDYVRYAQILNGTKGTGSENLLTVAFTQNVSYCQTAGLKSDGTLVIWNPADNA